MTVFATITKAISDATTNTLQQTKSRISTTPKLSLYNTLSTLAATSAAATIASTFLIPYFTHQRRTAEDWNVKLILLIGPSLIVLYYLLSVISPFPSIPALAPRTFHYGNGQQHTEKTGLTNRSTATLLTIAFFSIFSFSCGIVALVLTMLQDTSKEGWEMATLGCGLILSGFLEGWMFITGMKEARLYYGYGHPEMADEEQGIEVFVEVWVEEEESNTDSEPMREVQVIPV